MQTGADPEKRGGRQSIPLPPPHAEWINAYSWCFWKYKRKRGAAAPSAPSLNPSMAKQYHYACIMLCLLMFLGLWCCRFDELLNTRDTRAATRTISRLSKGHEKNQWWLRQCPRFNSVPRYLGVYDKYKQQKRKKDKLGKCLGLSVIS